MALPAFVMLIAAPAAASTFVPAGDLHSQTWTASGSPYVVQGDVRIPDGFTLVVGPGVIVEMAGGADLEVHGELRIEGLPQVPVTFTSPAAHPGAWGEIRLIHGSRATIDHAALEYPHNGVHVLGADAFTSTGLTVREAKLAAVLVQGDAVTLDRFSAYGFTFGIKVDGATVRVTNCLLRGGARSFDALQVTPAGAVSTESAFVEMVNCTLAGNGRHGINVVTAAGGIAVADVWNTLIIGNGGVGVLLGDLKVGDGAINLSYSDVAGNHGGELENVEPGDGVISEIPKFVDLFGLELEQGSPGVDGGTREGAPIHDLLGVARPSGLAIDMGAYELVIKPTP